MAWELSEKSFAANYCFFWFQNSCGIKKYVYTVILLWQIGIEKKKKTNPTHNSEHPECLSFACRHLRWVLLAQICLWSILGLTWCFQSSPVEAEILCIASGAVTMWLLLITVDKGLQSRFQTAFSKFFFSCMHSLNAEPNQSDIFSCLLMEMWHYTKLFLNCFQQMFFKWNLQRRTWKS